MIEVDTGKEEKTLSALLYEKLKLKTFKISVRSKCPKGYVLTLAIFKLTICDMIKNQKRGEL